MNVSLGDQVQKLSSQIGRQYEMIECNWGIVIMLPYQDHEKPFLSALPVGFCFVWCVAFSFYIYRRLSCLLYSLKTMFNSFCDILKYLHEKWWELAIHSATGKRSKDKGACLRDSFKTVTDFCGKKIFK